MNNVTTGIASFLLWGVCFSFLSMGVCKLILLRYGNASKENTLKYHKRYRFLSFLGGLLGVAVLVFTDISFAWKANALMFASTLAISFILALSMSEKSSHN